MNEALFISEEYLKEYTPIGELVQWSEVSSTAWIVQSSFVQDVLGTNFYKYLMNVYYLQTLSTDEIALMNYIKPALAYRVADKTLPFIHFQIKNKGVQTQRGDYSDPAELEVIRYLREELSSSAEFHFKRLSEYLCENSSLYPGYVTNNSDMMPPKPSSGYDCGLSFY
jgi:hypothetical protein